MFQEKYKEIMERYEAVVTRKNEKTDFYNGIYDRYKYPVLTRDHIPPFWKSKDQSIFYGKTGRKCRI